MPITVNGVDLETLGFIASDYTGDLTPAVDALPSVAVPGLAGEALTGAPAVVPTRTLTVNGTVVATSAATLDATVRRVIAACAGLATATPGQVALALAPEGSTATRQWTVGLTRNATVKRIGPDGLATAAAVSLAFVAQQPYAEDVAETVLGFPNGAPGVTAAASVGALIAPFPLGAVATCPVFEFTAPAGAFGDNGRAARTARVWVGNGDGSRGTLLGSLTITPASVVQAGAIVEVDGAAQTVTYVAPDGTRSAAAAWLTAGDFLALDPSAAGSGGYAVDLEGAGRVRYRRRWV